MNIVTLGLVPAVFGFVGAFTPCALGINAIFVGHVAGKDRPQRLVDWLLFALARATFLTLLGLAFGLIGQLIGDFVRNFTLFIAYVMILLGAIFIMSRFRPLPIPGLSLMPAVSNPGGDRRTGSRGALALGAFLGLDIPACTSPLVLALLAQTVLVGNYLSGAVALFIFGVAMSIPLLLVSSYEGANRWVLNAARRYGNAFYLGAGGLLMLVGLAQLSPAIMSIIGGWVQLLVGPFLFITS